MSYVEVDWAKVNRVMVADQWRTVDIGTFTFNSLDEPEDPRYFQYTSQGLYRITGPARSLQAVAEDV